MKEAKIQSEALKNKAMPKIRGWKRSLNNARWLHIIFPIVIGLISFLIIYGVTPLDVQNDHWIMAGYDESDIIQHYAGWISFRNSDWSYPLGLASDMAVEDGTFISYTDSIPWIAIFFKCIRSILPKTFQYFGIYTLVCYLLQSIAAFEIIEYKTGSMPFSSIATILLTFAPIEMERAFRHTALGSQWFILFAILIFIKHKENYRAIHYLGFAVLMILAIGIHPYFLPAIGIFLLLCVIEDLKRKRIQSTFYMVGILALTYVSGTIIGVLGTGVSPSRWGYGFFSMNLNAILNPTSCGGYTWSSFLKTHPLILGNYDGFNYLGVGVIFAGLLSLILTICTDIKNISLRIKKYAWEIIMLFGCTVFAVSNVVTFNDRTIVEIPLPEWMQLLCGIFRASSRIFYPVYYCLIFYIIVRIWRLVSKYGKIKSIIVISLIVIVQIIDIHSVIIEKHVRMLENSEYVSILDDETVGIILQDGQDILLDSFNGDSRSIAVAAGKNGCRLYYSVANSGSYERTSIKAAELVSYIKQTGDIGKHIVVTTDWNIVKDYLHFDGIGYYRNGDSYYIAQNAEGRLSSSADGYTASNE